jgi:hypothetical protein
MCMLRRAFTGQSLPALMMAIVRNRWTPISAAAASPAVCALSEAEAAAMNRIVGQCFLQAPAERWSAGAILAQGFGEAPLAGVAAAERARQQAALAAGVHAIRPPSCIFHSRFSI